MRSSRQRRRSPTRTRNQRSEHTSSSYSNSTIGSSQASSRYTSSISASASEATVRPPSEWDLRPPSQWSAERPPSSFISNATSVRPESAISSRNLRYDAPGSIDRDERLAREFQRLLNLDADAESRRVAEELAAADRSSRDWVAGSEALAQRTQGEQGPPRDWDAESRALAQRLQEEDDLSMNDAAVNDRRGRLLTAEQSGDHDASDRVMVERLQAELDDAGGTYMTDYYDDDDVATAIALSSQHSQVSEAPASSSIYSSSANRVRVQSAAPARAASSYSQASTSRVNPSTAPTRSSSARSRANPHRNRPTRIPAPIPHSSLRARLARRDLPLNPRVAAICMLSTPVPLSALSADEKDCTICSSTFGEPDDHGEIESPIRLRGCQHLFGDSCIHRWFRDNSSCPECRREYMDELQSENIDPATQSEEFALAYEAAMRREEAIEAVEAGRPREDDGETEDPFFAEPSMQDLERERAVNERLMEELNVDEDGRVSVFPLSGVHSRPESPVSRRMFQASEGSAGYRTPPRYGRPARPLSPQSDLWSQDTRGPVLYPRGTRIRTARELHQIAPGYFLSFRSAHARSQVPSRDPVLVRYSSPPRRRDFGASRPHGREINVNSASELEALLRDLPDEDCPLYVDIPEPPDSQTVEEIQDLVRRYGFDVRMVRDEPREIYRSARRRTSRRRRIW